MRYILEKQAEKWIVGISIRTSNAHFQEETAPIWERFYGENLGGKIPNRLSSNLFAVYTEYEGDYTKPYTFLLGCEVSNLENIPQGMKGVEIAPSTYAVFTAKGKFPDSLIATWHTIWKRDLKRTYRADFEIYSPDFVGKENPVIPVYIGIGEK